MQKITFESHFWQVSITGNLPTFDYFSFYEIIHRYWNQKVKNLRTTHDWGDGRGITP